MFFINYIDDNFKYLDTIPDNLIIKSSNGALITGPGIKKSIFV